jgi:hypothetical protein
MKKILWTMLLGGLALQASVHAEENYRTAVWFDALFDESGQVRELQAQDEAEQTPAFWAQLRSRVLRARIPPVSELGQPASFRTGVRVSLEVRKDASAGAVAIKGLEMAPLPIERNYVGYPADAKNSPGWSGSITVACTVTIEGLCRDIVVDALPGMPESVRKFGKASLEAWRFRPQEINGKPVEGRALVSLQLKTLDSQPKDFREPRRVF